MAYSYEYPYTDPNRSNSDWLLKSVKEVWEKVNQFTEWETEHKAEYEELKAIYDAIVSGNFPPSMEQGFKKWIEKNAINLIGELVKTVFFGLSDAGYFVAYIPESWQDIIFHTTGYDIIISDIGYGHLVLSY